jgi:hypothetical protein
VANNNYFDTPHTIVRDAYAQQAAAMLVRQPSAPVYTAHKSMAVNENVYSISRAKLIKNIERNNTSVT